MAQSIAVYMKNGTKKNYPHKARGWADWTKEIRYETGFAIITDEYGNETAIPAQDIEEIKIFKH